MNIKITLIKNLKNLKNFDNISVGQTLKCIKTHRCVGDEVNTLKEFKKGNLYQVVYKKITPIFFIEDRYVCSARPEYFEIYE